MRVIHEQPTVSNSFESYRQEEFIIKLSGKEAYDLYLLLHEDNHPKSLSSLMELLRVAACKFSWSSTW